MFQIRKVQISKDGTAMSVPGRNLAEIVTILVTINNHIQAWSTEFSHDFDVRISTGFEWNEKIENKFSRKAPVRYIRIWGKYPDDLTQGYRTVIGIELETHTGRKHLVMFNDLQFPEVRDTIEKLYKRFHSELMKNDIERAQERS
ncbi:hypothetical protein OBP_189 [Pseudomonas phage OBP]|uniref:hypothetical protein n=1 Tax=Pseudomonas phage OBP TaxID=1124849 RepID=UPI000240D59D|nr:hypothetical protein OBP_189 [Pseudomonas phage OBP]AEV89626.1 hypothetical protein OBP_189 [Pseudomonas phage OBP]